MIVALAGALSPGICDPSSAQAPSVACARPAAQQGQRMGSRRRRAVATAVTARGIVLACAPARRRWPQPAMEVT
jgi:hypothetical protein